MVACVLSAASCAEILGIDSWTPLPEPGDEGGAPAEGGSGGDQTNGGSSGSQNGGTGGNANGGGGGEGAMDVGGAGDGSGGGAGDDSGGTGGKGGTGGDAGASGQGGSGGSGGCTGTVCCMNGVPVTSGSCGTNCVCTSGGPAETDCKDGMDNDGDDDADCMDPDCLDELCTAAPTMVTIPVDEDTYVYTAAPTTSYGASMRVEVGLGSTARETGFVGVSGLNVERNIQVTSANLRLYLYGYDDDSTDTLIIELHRAVGAWNETLLWDQAYSGPSFSSAPALFDSAITHELALEDPTPMGCTAGCVYSPAWYSFTATSIVQAWMAGTSANHGFALTARLNNGTTNIYYFASREYTDSALRPHLNITYQASCNAQRICPSP
jgi:hypothetical protein